MVKYTASMDEDFEYDAYDRWEDEVLARMRDCDAMSDEETDTDSIEEVVTNGC